jgi:undecaprenyl-diphosphatase
VKTIDMQTSSTAAGAVGVPYRPRPQPATDTVPQDRGLFDPAPRGPAVRAAEHMPARPATAATIVTITSYVVLTLLTVATGLLLTKVVFDGNGGWDLEVNRWFAARRTPVWDDVSRFGSQVADTLTVIGVAAVVVLVLGCVRCWREIAFLVIALVLEVTVFVSTAFLVDRERPSVVRLDDAPPTSSFPSGHTAASVALYVGLALIVTSRVRNPLVRAAAWTLAIVAPLFVGTARLYRGMHFPSDVVSGVLLGLACLGAALLAVRTAVAASRRHEEVPV